ncbi:hypothetical protein Ancab_003284 [Ancistrocladus abbreviatus]
MEQMVEEVGEEEFQSIRFEGFKCDHQRIRKVAEPGSKSCRGFCQGIFEIGDGCINEEINGEKDNGFYALEALNSVSAIEKLGERIGLTQVGRGSGTKGIRKILTTAQTSSEKMGLEGLEEGPGYVADVLKAQREMVVDNTVICNRPSKSPRTLRNLTQTRVALEELQSDEESNLLKLPKRWGSTDISWPQCE